MPDSNREAIMRIYLPMTMRPPHSECSGMRIAAPARLASVGAREIEAGWADNPAHSEWLASRRMVTVIVNDSTRPAVAGRMLAPVARLLEGRCRILVATGTHREVSALEKSAQMCGLLEEAEWRCTRAEGDCGVRVGRTSFGTEVVLDEWVAAAEAVLVVNTVEPHYFAGFTGGRKSILPGSSAKRTILENHYLACLPGSRTAVLEGNPVHEDMAEAAKMVSDRVPVLHASGVVQGGELVQFFVGGLEEAFLQSVETSMRVACIALERRSSLVVARPGRPLDMNLYQAMKAVYNCEEAVTDGGMLLLDADCPEGLGADHMAASMEAVLDPDWPPPTRGSYGLGDHSTVRLKRMRQRIRLGLRSNLPEEIAVRMGFEAVRSIREAAEAAGEALILEEAGFSVPLVQGPSR